MKHLTTMEHELIEYLANEKIMSDCRAWLEKSNSTSLESNDLHEKMKKEIREQMQILLDELEDRNDGILKRTFRNGRAHLLYVKLTNHFRISRYGEDEKYRPFTWPNIFFDETYVYDRNYFGNIIECLEKVARLNLNLELIQVTTNMSSFFKSDGPNDSLPFDD